MFDQLVSHVGFGWTVRAIAFLILFLQLIAILTVRSRLTHTPSPVRIMAFLTPYREPVFLLNSIACFFASWGILIPFNYIVLTAEQAHMSPRLAAYLIPIINASSMFGRILPLWAGDHFGRFNLTILFTLLGTIFVLGLWIPSSSNASILVFAVLYGLPLGCFAASIPALVAQISDVKQIGVRVGATFFVNGFASLTGNPIAGALVTGRVGQEEYVYLKVFCGVTIGIGAVFFVVARIWQVGWGLGRNF